MVEPYCNAALGLISCCITISTTPFVPILYSNPCFKYCISCKNTIIVTKIVIPQQLFEV